MFRGFCFHPGMKLLKFISCCFFQVSANTENSSMSGYLQRSKGNKKHWKRLWFVIKNKVLYTYAASEVRRLCHLCVIFTVQLADILAELLFCPSGCCSFGESAFAGVFLERGEERASSETSVQVVSQKYAVLHF